MRNRCARTLSLLIFIRLSSSMTAETPVVRGQLHPMTRKTKSAYHLKPTTRPRCAAPNFGRRHRHLLLPKVWNRFAESERWQNVRGFNRLHGPRHSAANGQPNANSCATSGCSSVSTFMSRSL